MKLTEEQFKMLLEKDWDASGEEIDHSDLKIIQKAISTLGGEEEDLNTKRHDMQPTKIGLLATYGGDYKGRETTANSKRDKRSGLDILKKYLPDNWEEILRKHKIKVKHEAKKMSNLDVFLMRVTEEYAQATRLRCEVCGKIQEIQDEGRGPLLCCDKPMIVMSTYSPKMEAGFEKYPKGWDRDSVKKFGRTLSKKMKGGVKSKGFFDKCVKKMKGKVENPEGFCAGIKDEVYGSTGWRGKDKSPGEVRADVKKAKFKVESLLPIREFEEAYYITQCVHENERVEDKLLCLRKAYLLCGANRVCQQRIDRFYDAITGNYEGSGEAPLQTQVDPYAGEGN